jgi:hypothetical protein
VYKVEYGGAEGLFSALAFLVLPFLILYVLVKLLPPWEEARPTEETAPADPATGS